MTITFQNKVPRVHPSSYIAPNAVLCGDVTIGEHCRILFGATIVSEGSPVVIANNCIIMENAVIRGVSKHPTNLGNNVLVGPRSYLSGCCIEDNVFLATGTTVLNGACLKQGSEVRINGVVHISTLLPPDSVVPIGWIAVGNPAQILPPSAHDEIWSIQKPLNFPKTVFGLDRAPANEFMPKMCCKYSKFLQEHMNDREAN